MPHESPASDEADEAAISYASIRPRLKWRLDRRRRPHRDKSGEAEECSMASEDIVAGSVRSVGSRHNRPLLTRTRLIVMMGEIFWPCTTG
jgi:hypothetical protein